MGHACTSTKHFILLELSAVENSKYYKHSNNDTNIYHTGLTAGDTEREKQRKSKRGRGRDRGRHSLRYILSSQIYRNLLSELIGISIPNEL